MQFVFWVVGTTLGGALGFLAMWHPALALNPYGLVAVVFGVAMIVGSLGVTKARVGITLVLMTLSTLILVSHGRHVVSHFLTHTHIRCYGCGGTATLTQQQLALNEPWCRSLLSFVIMLAYRPASF